MECGCLQLGVGSDSAEEEAAEGMDDLHLTSQGGQELILTPKQLRTLTRPQLVRIWKGYVNELAQLLLLLEKGDHPASVTIKQYVEELVREPPLQLRLCQLCHDCFSPD